MLICLFVFYWKIYAKAHLFLFKVLHLEPQEFPKLQPLISQ